MHVMWNTTILHGIVSFVVFQAQKISSGMEAADIMFPATSNAPTRGAQIRLPASLLTANRANGEKRDGPLVCRVIVGTCM